jgi:hypothetical protein
MGESTSQIERDIAAERNELGRNLQLLENRARSLADWRTYFRSHPWAILAAAAGGGVLLGALTGGIGDSAASESEYETESTREQRFAASTPSAFSPTAARVRRQLGDTWDHIADALLGVASAKAIEWVSEKVPGFKEQFATHHPDYRSGRSV